MKGVLIIFFIMATPFCLLSYDITVISEMNFGRIMYGGQNASVSIVSDSILSLQGAKVSYRSNAVRSAKLKILGEAEEWIELIIQPTVLSGKNGTLSVDSIDTLDGVRKIQLDGRGEANIELVGRVSLGSQNISGRYVGTIRVTVRKINADINNKTIEDTATINVAAIIDADYPMEQITPLSFGAIKADIATTCLVSLSPNNGLSTTCGAVSAHSTGKFRQKLSSPTSVVVNSEGRLFGKAGDFVNIVFLKADYRVINGNLEVEVYGEISVPSTADGGEYFGNYEIVINY